MYCSTCQRARCSQSRCRRLFRAGRRKYLGVLPVTSEEVQLPCIADVAEEQRNDSVRARLEATVGKPGTQFDINENGIPVQRASIDGLLLKVLPAKLHRKVLQNDHDPVSAEHPAGCFMYSTMRSAYYWTHMAIYVHRNVEATWDIKGIVRTINTNVTSSSSAPVEA